MMIPAWTLDILAAIMLMVAGLSAARLAADRPWRLAAGDADVDAAHVLMGVAMAGTLVAGLSTLPNGVWAVIFGAMTAWFAWCVYRESRGHGARALAAGHHVPHLVHSAAMVYMFVAVAAPAAAGSGSGMSGMTSASGTAMQTLNAPAVAFIFALLLAGLAVLDTDRLSGLAGRAGGLADGAIAPAGTALAGPSAAGGSLGTALAVAPSALAGSGAVATVPQQATSTGDPAGDGTRGSSLGTSRGILLSPRLTVGCRIAMGVTMAFMLIIMI